MPGLKPFEVRKAAPGAGAPARAAGPYFLRPQSTPKPPRLPHAITRFLANAWYDRDSRLLIVVSTRCGNGDGTWAVRPVFSGPPRDWRRPLVEFASDPPAIRLGAWIVASALIALAAGQGRPLIRNLAQAGVLGVLGMLSAQFETQSRATVILDSPVATTITGRVERREGDGRGRWRYIISLSLSQTQSPGTLSLPRTAALSRLSKGKSLHQIDSIRLTSSSINGEGRSRRT